MPTIRLATPSDWLFWHALDGHISHALFLRKAAAGECYFAEAEGAPAGLLRWNLFWDSVPFCTMLMIAEAWRGRGLGRALMARWEITFYRHPERFSENTNEYLQCRNCTEKLCTHKKQLKTLWVHIEEYTARRH